MRLGRPFFYETLKMTSEENREMLHKFKMMKYENPVLLAVQVGRSSEGVDYPGREMIASVIVGVPYAEPMPRLEEQERFYNRLFGGEGRDLTYTIPVIRKASHAAGRPLRSLNDIGG
jgi:DNA excision repair protein ERCC-2